MSSPVRKNAYVCKAGHTFVTVDRDEGVTPFIMRCGTCELDAYSAMYRLPPELAAEEPHGEWFKPTPEEFARLSPAMRDHVEQGGLVFRKLRDGAPDMARQWAK